MQIRNQQIKQTLRHRCSDDLSALGLSFENAPLSLKCAGPCSPTSIAMT